MGSDRTSRHQRHMKRGRDVKTKLISAELCSYSLPTSLLSFALIYFCNFLHQYSLSAMAVGGRWWGGGLLQHPHDVQTTTEPTRREKKHFLFRFHSGRHKKTKPSKSVRPFSSSLALFTRPRPPPSLPPHPREFSCSHGWKCLPRTHN